MEKSIATRNEIYLCLCNNIKHIAKLSHSKAYDFTEKKLNKIINYKKFDTVVDDLIDKIRSKKLILV